jgi:hypothetical protein
MAAVGELEVKVTADTREFDAAVKGVTRKLMVRDAGTVVLGVSVALLLRDAFIALFTVLFGG